MKVSFSKIVATAMAVVVFAGILVSCVSDKGVIRGGENKEKAEEDRELLTVEVQDGDQQFVEVYNDGVASYTTSSSSTSPTAKKEEAMAHPAGALSCQSGELHALLNLKVDSKFSSYGKYRLGDDDDDDDDSSSTAKKYWNVGKSSYSSKDLVQDEICLDKNGCYEFIIYGENKAFYRPNNITINNKDGYALLMVDVGDGLKNQLEIDYTFNKHKVSFGCGCERFAFDPTNHCPTSA